MTMSRQKAIKNYQNVSAKDLEDNFVRMEKIKKNKVINLKYNR